MEYSKLSGALAAASEQYTERGRQTLGTHSKLLGLVTVTEPARPARAVVFVRGTDAKALDRLQYDGLEVNEGTGTVRTGIVDFEALDAVTADPALSQLVVAHRLRTLMDVAPGKVGVPAFVKDTHLDGTGVVVGIVDTGIDSQHPAFQGRIERVWDQTLHGKGVPEGRYGVELKGDRLIESHDEHGHGTHVAGIASGADAKFPGIAPQARLVIVKTDLMDPHIADGVRYCFRVAAQLGLPAVVNLSLGGHADPHDGTDPMSEIITNGSPVRKYVLADGTVQIATPGADPVNHDHQVVVVAEPSAFGGVAPSRTWRIRFRGVKIGKGRVDAWVLSNDEAASMFRDADFDRGFVLDTRHVMLAGTSMASPFLAGVVALLLQRDKTLEPAKLRQRLISASAVPGGKEAAFDRQWGYGLLSVDHLGSQSA